nr:NSP3 [Bat RVJ-like rotavirus BtSY3]
MAELVISLVRETLDNMLGNEETINSLIHDLKTRMLDTGLYENVNNWRDCFYKKRIPKEMTATTVNIQIKNLEDEVIRLRSNAYSDGYDREIRTLSQFKVEKNGRGQTILTPTSELTKIILANSKIPNFQLSGVPCAQFEKLCFELEDRKRHNEILCSEIATLKGMLDTQEDARSEVRALQSVLSAERNHKKRIAEQRDEAQCLLAAVCNRFGLQCEIDNSRGCVTMPDPTGKRKGRKKRRVPICAYSFGASESDSSSSSFSYSPVPHTTPIYSSSDDETTPLISNLSINPAPTNT